MARATGRAVRPCRDRFCRGVRETQPGPASTDGRGACAATSVVRISGCRRQDNQDNATFSAPKSVSPEIKGYTQEYLDASSPRSQQIRGYLERTGRSGKEAAEIAAHSTRDRKEVHSPAEVMAAHRKLAADFGHQAEAVVAAARERAQHQSEHRENPVNSFERVRESLTFSRDKNFEREAVVDERALIRDGLRRGMGEITHTQVRANLEARLASGEFQIVERLNSSNQFFDAAANSSEKTASNRRSSS